MPKENLRDQYNCGPVKFSGGDNALYERHLIFDQIIPVKEATPRDRFEAIAHSIRNVLSQRWLQAEQTYRERNAKRVYCLSLEFLLGRALFFSCHSGRLELQVCTRHASRCSHILTAASLTRCRPYGIAKSRIARIGILSPSGVLLCRRILLCTHRRTGREAARLRSATVAVRSEGHFDEKVSAAEPPSEGSQFNFPITLL